MSKTAFDITLYDQHLNVSFKSLFVTSCISDNVDYLTFYHETLSKPLFRVFFYSGKTRIYNYKNKKFTFGFVLGLRCLPHDMALDVSHVDLKYWNKKLAYKSGVNLHLSDQLLQNINWHQQLNRKHLYVEKMAPIYKAFDKFKMPNDIEKFFNSTVFKNNGFSIFDEKEKTIYCTSCKKNYSSEEKLSNDDKTVCHHCMSENLVKLKRYYMRTKRLETLGICNILENTDVGLVVRYFRVYRNCADYEYTYIWIETSRTLITPKTLRLGFKYNNYVGYNWHKTGTRTSMYYNGYYTYEPAVIYPNYSLKNTGLENSGFDLYNQVTNLCDPISYMNWYKEFNGLEQLSKYGLHKLIHSTISSFTTYDNLNIE